MPSSVSASFKSKLPLVGGWSKIDFIANSAQLNWGLAELDPAQPQLVHLHTHPNIHLHISLTGLGLPELGTAQPQLVKIISSYIVIHRYTKS